MAPLFHPKSLLLAQLGDEDVMLMTEEESYSRFPLVGPAAEPSPGLRVLLPGRAAFPSSLACDVIGSLPSV